MADRLRAFMAYIAKGIANDFDYVIIIDGPEGGGKSTLAAHAKAMYDGHYNMTNVCYDSTDLLNIMQNARKGSCIILDEAVTSFMSRTSLDRFQVRLIQAFSIVRERNLVFFLLIPNLGLLDKALQTRALYRIWVYPKGQLRGYAKIYYSKRTPWTTGKPWHEEAWHYEFPKLPDRFEAEYKKFKRKELARKLKEYDDEIKYEKDRKEKEKRKVTGKKTQLIIQALKNNPKATDIEIAKECGCSLAWVRQQAPIYRE